MLSKRLQAVADMITPGKVVADVGTDHGYVPIYLVSHNIVEKAYAMDINKGPLEKANQHINEAGLEDRVKTILSDGMEKLEEGMVNSVVIAGMGGELIVKILKSSTVLNSLDELILSPHRDNNLVRQFLLVNGWKIINEAMVEDNKKYYTIIKAVPGLDEAYLPEEIVYGKILLEEKNSKLFQYLEKERDKYLNIKSKIESNSKDKIKDVTDDLQKIDSILELNNKALCRFK